MAKDYYYGRGGGHNDYALAFKVFRRNADLDNRYWYMAVKHVGIMYALGEGVKQDVNEALRYLKVYADWMEKDDCWDEFVTYYYGLLARRAYKENNYEEVDKYMQKILINLATHYALSIMEHIYFKEFHFLMNYITEKTQMEKILLKDINIY